MNLTISQSFKVFLKSEFIFLIDFSFSDTTLPFIKMKTLFHFIEASLFERFLNKFK